MVHTLYMRRGCGAASGCQPTAHMHIAAVQTKQWTL
jgi:hypothetical protein